MKKQTILAAILLIVSSCFTYAGDILSLKAGHPETYVVKKGDTLWDISGMYLNKPWRWPEIWHVNPQIQNPHLIYPGDILNLVYIDGKPRLMIKRSTGGVVKLSPQMKISDLDSAIKAIPLQVISPFMSMSQVVNAGDLSTAPYVLGGKGGRIIGGAGDIFYARGDFSDNANSYAIFRKGSAFIDPDTGNVLGQQAVYIGSSDVLQLTDSQSGKAGEREDVAEFELVKTREEVRRDDLLMKSSDASFNADFHPSAPDFDVNAKIIAVEGGVSQVGAMDVVVINRGVHDGLKQGHVLSVYHKGEVLRDKKAKDTVKLPDSRAGLMMIYRTFDHVSYGLVLRANTPLAVLDIVKNP